MQRETLILMIMAREWMDKLFRSGIKLAMLTGVAFTVTACYGAPYTNYTEEDNDTVEAAQMQVEEQLTDSQYVD